MKTASIIALMAAAGLANAGIAASADISGLDSWDVEGDLDNVVFTYDLAAGAGFASGTDLVVSAVAWDTIFTSAGASWGSEATIAMDFDGDGMNDLYITPSSTGAPVTSEANSSGGFVYLNDAGIGDILAVDGTIVIELFESFDDVDGVVDGTWGPDSSVSFLVPAPGAAALLGLGGLVATRRRR